jgi:hypothetical protein
MREIQRGREGFHDEHRIERPPLDHIDAKILAMLDKAPFESARSMPHVLGVDDATVLHHLQAKLGLKSHYLRWVSHLLTDELRAKQKEFASLMIPYIVAAKRDGWRHFVTGDKTWFFLLSGPRRRWALGKDDVVTKPRTGIQSKKFMFTIMWNPLGFHLIDRLPTGDRINNSYYVTHILEPLHQVFFPGGRTPHEKRLVVHVDNCSVHKSRVTKTFIQNNDMADMPHHPYSPDLAPSDFYLFDTVKKKLKYEGITDEDQFSEVLVKILKAIPGEELVAVFETWLERVRRVSEGDGSYID